jgi:hypothetical protein
MNSLRIGSAALALALLSSCASVSVRSVNHAHQRPTRKPDKIYIAQFDTTRGTFRIVGAEAKDPEAFKQKIAGLVAKYVAKDVNLHVAPAQVTTTPHSLPRSGWLVTGEFLRVHTGSRVLRAVVGLGAGGTKMETRVSVIDLSGAGHQPFLTFETTGGSNAMPGMMESSSPWGAALSMTAQSMMGVTDDAARTSRMITGELNTYMIQRGWLSKSNVYEAKAPGKFQLVHEHYIPSAGSPSH